MATVTIEINGRPYAVGCADGQEERVRVLARQFDSHVQRVAGDVGQVGDIRLFLMAALVLADELHEARLQPGSPAAGGAADPPSTFDIPSPDQPHLAEILNAAATRIERLAAEL